MNIFFLIFSILFSTWSLATDFSKTSEFTQYDFIDFENFHLALKEGNFTSLTAVTDMKPQNGSIFKISNNLYDPLIRGLSVNLTRKKSGLIILSSYDNFLASLYYKKPKKDKEILSAFKLWKMQKGEEIYLYFVKYETKDQNPVPRFLPTKTINKAQNLSSLSQELGLKRNLSDDEAKNYIDAALAKLNYSSNDAQQNTTKTENKENDSHIHNSVLQSLTEKEDSLNDDFNWEAFL